MIVVISILVHLNGNIIKLGETVIEIKQKKTNKQNQNLKKSEKF